MANDLSVSVVNHWWAPIPEATQSIELYCDNNSLTKVLEIGPGVVPFSKATSFIGCNEHITNYESVDIDTEKFPYEDDHFDFVYCRHVLEDIQNPDFALKEICRVSKKGGYIETPSPLIEATKGVDGTMFNDKYCGYIHHRYIVWSNSEKNEIYFLPKYSCILDNVLQIHNSEIYNFINNNPLYWNNYFLFTEEPNIIIYKNGVNFGITVDGKSNMVDDYIKLVIRAINESIKNTDRFVSQIKEGKDIQNDTGNC